MVSVYTKLGAEEIGTQLLEGIDDRECLLLYCRPAQLGARKLVADILNDAFEAVFIRLTKDGATCKVARICVKNVRFVRTGKCHD
jgi:hypothetical protein